jgi:hypothetical protein
MPGSTPALSAPPATPSNSPTAPRPPSRHAVCRPPPVIAPAPPHRKFPPMPFPSPSADSGAIAERSTVIWPQHVVDDPSVAFGHGVTARRSCKLLTASATATAGRGPRCCMRRPAARARRRAVDGATRAAVVTSDAVAEVHRRYEPGVTSEAGRVVRLRLSAGPGGRAAVRGHAPAAARSDVPAVSGRTPRHRPLRHDRRPSRPGAGSR